MENPARPRVPGLIGAGLGCTRHPAMEHIQSEDLRPAHSHPQERLVYLWHVLLVDVGIGSRDALLAV